MLRTWQNYRFVMAYAAILAAFLWGADFAMPIEAIPDETAQLKNVYGMINSRSLFLQYPSSYSVWTHYSYIIPTLLYWGGQYLVGDFASLEAFKQYVLNHYQDVLPFLRGYTALIFFIGLVLIRRVLQAGLNTFQANTFVLLTGLHLLIVINVHYSKHWMMDFGLVLISLYLYWIALHNNRNLYKYGAFFLFSVAVLSTPLFITSGIYFVALGIRYLSRKRQVVNVVEFTLFFTALFFLTYTFLGVGGVVGSAEGLKLFAYNYLDDVLFVDFDYSPVSAVVFVLSVVYMGIMRNSTMLLLLSPYLFNLLILSCFDHFEVRYAIYNLVVGFLAATFFLHYLYRKWHKAALFLLFLIISTNTLLVGKWLQLADSVDTRVKARSWLSDHVGQDTFIIYNTFGFNYLPLTQLSVRYMQANFPKAVGTRESLHLAHALDEGRNGMIMWKLTDAGYNIKNVIGAMRSAGYSVILVNERYGHVYGKNTFWQPHVREFDLVMQGCESRVVKEILPYAKEPVDRERIGDVLYNFNYVWDTLWTLETSGPNITVFEVEKCF